MSKVSIEDGIYVLNESEVSVSYKKKEDIPDFAARKKGEAFERVIKETQGIKEAEPDEEGISSAEAAEETEEAAVNEESIRIISDDELQKIYESRDKDSEDENAFSEPEEPACEHQTEKEAAPVVLLKGRKETIQVDHYPFVIGRYDSDYDIDDTYISGNHCEITEENGNIYVEDLGSTNKTYIGDNRVKEKTILKGGQNLFIADRRYKVEIL